MSTSVQHLRAHPNSLRPLRRLTIFAGARPRRRKVAKRTAIFPRQQQRTRGQEHTLVVILHGDVAFGKERVLMYCLDRVPDDGSFKAAVFPVDLTKRWWEK